MTDAKQYSQAEINRVLQEFHDLGAAQRKELGFGADLLARYPLSVDEARQQIDAFISRAEAVHALQRVPAPVHESKGLRLFGLFGSRDGQAQEPALKKGSSRTIHTMKKG